jgi:transcriptional regulator with XRE-family HTH domain
VVDGVTERSRTTGLNRSSPLLGDYLRARRAVLQPQDVGLPRDRHRRVDGLRRQEVAALARISIDYYLRLEQGRDRQPSDQVVVALAGALQVGEFGLRHMRRLVQLQTQRHVPSRPSIIDATVRALLDFWPVTPVVIVDSNFDVVLSNDLALALDEELLAPGSNFVVGMFDRQATALGGERQMAERAAAALRFRCDPDDVRLREIVGRLAQGDSTFRRLWARHDSVPWLDGLMYSAVDGMGLLPFRVRALDVPSIEGWSAIAFRPADPRAEVALESLAVLSESRADLLSQLSA